MDFCMDLVVIRHAAEESSVCGIIMHVTGSCLHGSYLRSYREITEAGYELCMDLVVIRHAAEESSVCGIIMHVTGSCLHGSYLRSYREITEAGYELCMDLVVIITNTNTTSLVNSYFYGVCFRGALEVSFGGTYPFGPPVSSRG